MKVFPAINTLPTRAEPLLLADTEYDTPPLPEALAPAVIVNQLALLIADQPQPAPADTFTVPEPPFLPNVFIVGEIANVQLPPPD